MVTTGDEHLPAKREPRGRARQEADALDVVNAILDRVEPVITLINTLAERSLKAREAEGRFKIRMAWMVAGLVAVIVGAASVLTYVGKMDGSTFGFLLGLVVGYVLTFIRDAIYPPKTTPGG